MLSRTVLTSMIYLFSLSASAQDKSNSCYEYSSNGTNEHVSNIYKETLILNSGSFSQISKGAELSLLSESDCKEILSHGKTLFYFDQSEVIERFRLSLESILEIDMSEKMIVIEGHADEYGSNGYNQKLGMKRAEAVREYLISNGVDSKKIKIVSKGSNELISFGTKKDGLSENRRAEIFVLSN